MGDQKVLNCLYDKFDFCKRSVTDLSKTDEREFIVSDIQMYGGDELNKSQNSEDLQTVDAIYPIFDENGLTLYFFEFKKYDFLDEFFDAKIPLKRYIKEMESCIYDCRYSKCLKKIQKKLISKKVISLKLKPLESLILLNNLLSEYGVSSEDLVKINKEYYIVSLTNIPENFNNPNKDNSRRKGRLKEIFDFRNKISPFPFSNVEPLNEQSFISMIEELEEKNIFNSMKK